MSSSVKLDNKDEILELLREASERLPEEVRQGRWMLKNARSSWPPPSAKPTNWWRRPGRKLKGSCSAPKS